MKTSIVLLTYNRKEYVERSINQNLNNAGYKIDEIIWVDNGSTDGVLGLDIPADTIVFNKENQGVARGYNAGFKLASGDLIVKPGTDMLLPQGWLATFVKYHEAVPNSGVAAYFHKNFENLAERKIGGLKEAAGLPYQPAIALGVQAIAREVFEKVGYLPDLGVKYGMDDVHFDIAVRKAGFTNYYIPGVKPEHLGDRDGIDYPEYREAKNKELKKYVRRSPKEIPGSSETEEAATATSSQARES